MPDWFRDAKFGIWAHWGPQCQPEFGDWYARLMYIQGRQSWKQGETAYENHLRRYGHPSRTGFLDIIGQWKAENWQPEELLSRYVKAGARYFMAMGCHHDNFDLFASKHHEWNSTRVGPKRDIVGGWEPVVRAGGAEVRRLEPFEPRLALVSGRLRLRCRKGRCAAAATTLIGCGRSTARASSGRASTRRSSTPGLIMSPPDGITSAAEMNAWHDKRDGQWLEAAPPANRRFVDKWLLRQNQIVDDYRPDLIYFDDTGLAARPDRPRGGRALLQSGA